MEASARETGRLRRRTADDNLQTKGLARLRRVEDGDSSSSESDPDLDMGDNDRDGSDDSGEFDESLLEGLDLDGVRGGVRGRTGTGVAAPGEQGGKDEEERAVLDAQFEAVRTRDGAQHFCCTSTACCAPDGAGVKLCADFCVISL